MRFAPKCILLFCLILVQSFLFAADSPILLFVSNNQNEISLQLAYARLQGAPQTDLINTTTQLLKTQKIPLQSHESVLGAYQMESDKDLTADNTEIFYLVNQQSLPLSQVEKLAQSLAQTFGQESVAVFFPNKLGTSEDIKVDFSNPLGISETVGLIKEKLPLTYQEAFTLHFASNILLKFKDEKVGEIEWLGSNLNLSDIKKAFPGAAIVDQHGEAYLVFKNGNLQSL